LIEHDQVDATALKLAGKVDQVRQGPAELRDDNLVI